jgi:hypothetical protein
LFWAIFATDLKTLYDKSIFSILDSSYILLTIFLVIINGFIGISLPSIIEFILCIVFGIILYFAICFFVKGCQIENTGKIMGITTLSVIGIVAADRIFINVWGITGSLLILICVIILVRNSRRRIHVDDNDGENENIG